MDSNVFEEIGIPRKYIKGTRRENRYVAVVHRTWLRALVKHSKLTEFIENNRSESRSYSDDDLDRSWTRILLQVLRKRDAKVLPLPRIRGSLKEEAPLFFSQLMQYISQTNYKNLWKEAYKKYMGAGDSLKDVQVALADYNDVLREAIIRTYGCSVMNACDPSQSIEASRHFDVNVNVLPAVCAVETLNSFFIFHVPYFEYTLYDCVTFSPAILEKCFTKPLFVVYQILQTLKSLHDRSLTLGDISLSDIYLNEDLWIQVFPQLSSNLHVQDIPKRSTKMSGVGVDCRRTGHKFDTSLRCENCGIKTYDKHQVTNETLEQLCQLWVEGKISNFTYLTALNNLSGRKLGDPNCHHVFPWVTDFSSRCGKNWRDLKKSKYRLNKGDRQLDLQYENNQTQVPHHVSDVLSSITYYVYMARRTRKSVLCKHVRTVWVPAEYPSSIQRMQEWTPDECIPEFFSDPTVFKSIHDDLEDLEVPPWSSSPEDFVEKHREALESNHVSERLHHWIDLTFGYKLSGHAAVKAKNVCLHLVDEHKNLTKSGIVQLFTRPHPPRSIQSPFWSKSPPKILLQKTSSHKTRERSHSSTSTMESFRSDEEPPVENTPLVPSTSRSPLVLSHFLSRSRNSLSEEQSGQRGSRSPSSSRSASLGPKNATFVGQKAKTAQLGMPPQSHSNAVIVLPKEYRPEALLEGLEKLHGFVSKTFHVEEGKKIRIDESREGTPKDSEECVVQNAFTNKIFSENFRKNLATKSYTFPMDNQNLLPYCTSKTNVSPKKENLVTCNYSEIVASRRVRELQVLGCLLVEIFMNKQLRCLNRYDSNKSFPYRLKTCVTAARAHRHEIPPCVRYLITLLLNLDSSDLSDFKYPVVSDLGLPPPSAHLLLEPLVHCIISFPKQFLNLYAVVSSLKRFSTVSEDLKVLYFVECTGNACAEYANVERTKVLLAQNIGECKVKLCARNLEVLLYHLNTTTDSEIVNILLPHMKALIEDPSTSILAAWYLFDPFSRALGVQKTKENLLLSLLKLYENEQNENVAFFTSKIVKLYHHSFLLCLIVRLGLKCFLENFITPLVEAVGGYRDCEQVDFVCRGHNEKIVRKTSNLKTMSTEESIPPPADVSDSDSERNTPPPKKEDSKAPEEIFEFEPEATKVDSMKNIIEQLELNVETELPFDHSTAEEALDAALTENIDHMRNLEELTITIGDDRENIMSPTIPIPTRQFELSNISCDVGSKKSENEQFLEDFSDHSHFDDSSSTGQSRRSFDIPTTPTSRRTSKSTQKSERNDAKISDMSSDSLIWLAHRLGPVLTARYLSRNLLKMLTLCYVGKESLEFVPVDNTQERLLSIACSNVFGDQNALKVLECLSNITALYGEHLILVQYFPHMSELITLCKRRLTQNLEGGLISCLALLKYIIPYLSDAALMDQLQDIILKNILHPIIRLMGSTKYTFPSGPQARLVVARKFLDAFYLISLRIGAEMTRIHLLVPGLQRFFLIFDKIGDDPTSNETVESKFGDREKELSKSVDESRYVELRRDGTMTEWAVGGRPIQIAHVRLKDSDSVESLSPPPIMLPSENAEGDGIINQALEELRFVFTPELAHAAYVPFLKQIGLNALETSLKNHAMIQQLYQEHELQLKTSRPNVSSQSQGDASDTIKLSSSIGSNIALIGNRIDVQSENADTNLLKLVSNKMENESRHLRGNWLAYWEHEIGRADKDTRFNFKQIKLQTFAGHTHSVKALYVLDNENSFISGSRDKTVKLWSLRSQGDGSSTSSCQWTYTAHRKSILAISFIESLRLVASCDSVVHVWDPFLGVNISSLESPKYAPVNVLKSMPAPSTQILAATTDGTVKIVDARVCTYVHELKVSLNPSGLIRCLTISPSGAWMAAGHSSGQITVLDTRTGLVISTWTAHEGEVLQLVPVGEDTLLSSSLDQTVSVWNIQDGKFKFNMKGATEPVHCLNVYNSELVSGTTANRIGVHTSIDADASFSSTKLRSDAFKGLLTSMAVLPLNRLLLLGADNGNVVLLC